jgi:hypothetical protein
MIFENFRSEISGHVDWGFPLPLQTTSPYDGEKKKALVLASRQLVDDRLALGSSSIAHLPISSIGRLQARQKPLVRSIVQMPMQGDITRLSGGGPSDMA